MAYNSITLGDFRNELLLRLNSNGADFWLNAELNEYISESLSVWNTLTQWWLADQTLILNPPLTSDWIPTNGVGTPRAQTLTESDLYSILCYHLIEPQPIAGIWQGTTQFSMPNLQQSAQNILNEIMIKTAVNMTVNTSLSITPNTSRITLPDTILDLRRVRYSAVDGSNVTLTRGDSQSFLRFSPNYRQTNAPPRRFDTIGSPPLTLTVDTLVNQPNTLELLAMSCANTLNPVSPQPLLIPNDWLWVLKYGVMADLLTNEPEASDTGRAAYCQRRYEQGLALMTSQPWLMNAFIDEKACDTPPVTSKDRNSYEWQSNPSAWLGVVVVGIDLIAPSPIPTVQSSIKLTVVANAPQPATDADFIQAPRDILDVLLDYCQHIAVLKQGEEGYIKSLPLLKGFLAYAEETNSRLRASGIFSSDLRPSTSRQDLAAPRTVTVNQ